MGSSRGGREGRARSRQPRLPKASSPTRSPSLSLGAEIERAGPVGPNASVTAMRMIASRSSSTTPTRLSAALARASSLEHSFLQPAQVELQLAERAEKPRGGHDEHVERVSEAGALGEGARRRLLLLQPLLLLLVFLLLLQALDDAAAAARAARRVGAERGRPRSPPSSKRQHETRTRRRAINVDGA